jgi:hypothetical protein
MKLTWKTVCLVGLAGVLACPATADETDAKAAKDLKKVIDDQSINYVETAQKGISLSGYVDVSYTNQFAGRGQAFGTTDIDHNSQSTLREFDRNADGFNVQAVKLALEKALPESNDWAAGFRVDTILGSDAKYLGDVALGGNVFPGIQGNNPGGVALEQALVKFRLPVGNGLDVYAGKFAAFFGYEVIESPANLNFSRGLLFTNEIPLTNTGVYFDYKFNALVEAKLGVVDGWDDSTSTVSGENSSFGRANEDYPFGGKAIIGQVNVTAPGKNANLCQSFFYSPENSASAYTQLNLSGDSGPVLLYDVWGSWNPTFVKDSALTLAVNIDLGWSGAAGLVYTPSPVLILPQAWHEDTNTWWGIAAYSSYRLNRIVTLSGRGEYIHTDEVTGNSPKFGTGFTGDFIPDSQDDFSYTVTAAFNIWENLLTRIEYRVDVLQGSTVFEIGRDTGGGFPGQHQQVQNQVAVEAVYAF